MPPGLATARGQPTGWDFLRGHGKAPREKEGTAEKTDAERGGLRPLPPGGPSPAHPCPSHLDSGFWRPEPGHTPSGVVSTWRMAPGMAATGHHTKLTRTKTRHRSPWGGPASAWHKGQLA